MTAFNLCAGASVSVVAQCEQLIQAQLLRLDKVTCVSGCHAAPENNLGHQVRLLVVKPMACTVTVQLEGQSSGRGGRAAVPLARAGLGSGSEPFMATWLRVCSNCNIFPTIARKTLALSVSELSLFGKHSSRSR